MPISRAVRVLTACAVVLVLGHLAGLAARQVWDVDPHLGLVRQFDLNGEGNLAAWYSSLVLAGSALLAFLVATLRRLAGDRMAGRWAALAALLLLMAADETSQLHDMATGPLRNGLDLDFGALYFAWLMPALLLLGVAAWYFAPLVSSMSSAVLPRFLVAVAVYLSGAVVCEMIGGSAVREGREALSYLAVITVEETLEVTGGLLLLHALLVAVRELRAEVAVRWTGADPELTLHAVATGARVSEPTG